MTPLFRVLYCSRSLLPADDPASSAASAIADILAKSRRNNARDGITGGLLFSEGCFAQVLEGPAAAVERTFERIQCDQRHREVVVLQAGPIDARDFSRWSMAFAGLPAGAFAGVPAGALAGALGGAGSTGAPPVTLDPADALSGQSGAGDRMLDLLRSVVVDGTAWLRPAPG